MRLFLAINLPEAVRRTVYDATLELRRAAPSVRWVQPDTLHLTLKFLGEVVEARLTELRRALNEGASGTAAFEVMLRAVGAFPNFRRPRVVWLDVANPEALVRLQQRIEEAYVPLGFPREARGFHPHLTLGRMGDGIAGYELRGLERAAGEIKYEAQVRVESVELMQSRLSPQGARYEPVASVALRKGSS